MIYLASPYSSDDEGLVHTRVRQTLHFTARKIMLGHVIFSPIVYTSTFANAYSFGTTAEDWEHFNTEMMKKANELWVLQLNGWEFSKGVRHEISFFAARGISPRYFSDWRE